MRHQAPFDERGLGLQSSGSGWAIRRPEEQGVEPGMAARHRQCDRKGQVTAAPHRGFHVRAQGPVGERWRGIRSRRPGTRAGWRSAFIVVAPSEMNADCYLSAPGQPSFT
jgi:hypothetical protein